MEIAVPSSQISYSPRGGCLRKFMDMDNKILYRRELDWNTTELKNQRLFIYKASETLTVNPSNNVYIKLFYSPNVHIYKPIYGQAIFIYSQYAN